MFSFLSRGNSYSIAKFLQEKVTRSIELLKTPLFSLELLLALFALGFNIWESIWADCWISHRYLDRVLVRKGSLFGTTHHFIGTFAFVTWECYSKKTYVAFQRSVGLLLEIVLSIVGWMLREMNCMVQGKKMKTLKELYLQCLDKDFRKTSIPRISYAFSNDARMKAVGCGIALLNMSFCIGWQRLSAFLVGCGIALLNASFRIRQEWFSMFSLCFSIILQHASSWIKRKRCMICLSVVSYLHRCLCGDNGGNHMPVITIDIKSF